MVSATGQAVFAVVAKDAASAVMGKIGNSMGKLQGVAGAVFKTIAAGATAAASAIAGIAIASIKGAMEDQKAQTRMVATLQARGLATEKNIAAIDKLIQSGQKLGFTDDNVRGSIETATQYTKKFSDALKINKVAQDLAVAKGMDLEAATSIVGKAFQGNGKALKALGINLQKTTAITKFKTVTDKEATKAAHEKIDAINKERKAHGLAKLAYGEVITKQQEYVVSQRSTIKGQEALNLILDQYGGIAKAVAETPAAKLEAAQIRINEAFESFGAQFLPDVANALDWFSTNAIPALETALNGLGPVIKKVVGWFVDDFIPKAIKQTETDFGPLIDKLALVAGGLGNLGSKAKAAFGKDWTDAFQQVSISTTIVNLFKAALDGVIAAMRLLNLLPPEALGGTSMLGGQLPGAPGRGGLPKRGGPNFNVQTVQPMPISVDTKLYLDGKVVASTVDKYLGTKAIVAGSSRTIPGVR